MQNTTSLMSSIAPHLPTTLEFATLACAILHNMPLPKSERTSAFPTEAGRYCIRLVRGDREDMEVGMYGRVESGGRVENDRKASEVAPRG